MLNPAEKLEALLEKVYEEQKYASALAQGQKIYDIRKFRIQQLSIQKVLEMHYNISINFYQQNIIHQPFLWRQNQLKLFIWVLILYAHYHHKSISELQDLDYTHFASIFLNKHQSVFEYEAKSILKKQHKNRKWESHQVKIFYEISKKYCFQNKWNTIAKQLFLHSNKSYFRTGKQCRQYWNNHLNPNISHSSWSITEDFNLLQSVMNEGKKWAKISKLLGGKRTQHMIKNRYKSLYNFEKKHAAYEEEEWLVMDRLRMKLQEKEEEGKNKEELDFWKVEENGIYEGFFGEVS